MIPNHPPHFAIIGAEGMGRQVFDQAAAFNAANGSAPAVVFESTGQACSEGKGSVAPEIFVVVRPVDFLDEVETFSHFTIDRVVG